MSYKKENLIRRFDWRLAAIDTMVKGALTETVYVVERRTKLLGIPFWWTKDWEYNNCDGINFNMERHATKEAAQSQLDRWKKTLSYHQRPVQQKRLLDEPAPASNVLYTVTQETNFCMVYELPEELVEGFCFNGGVPETFLLVNWFNPTSELNLPADLTLESNFELQNSLREFIQMGGYYKPKRSYVVITAYGDAFTIPPKDKK